MKNYKRESLIRPRITQCRLEPFRSLYWRNEERKNRNVWFRRHCCSLPQNLYKKQAIPKQEHIWQRFLFYLLPFTLNRITYRSNLRKKVFNVTWHAKTASSSHQRFRTQRCPTHQRNSFSGVWCPKWYLVGRQSTWIDCRTQPYPRHRWHYGTESTRTNWLVIEAVTRFSL